MLAPKPHDSASGVAPGERQQTSTRDRHRRGFGGSHGTLLASGAANDALPGSGAPLPSQPSWPNTSGLVSCRCHRTRVGKSPTCVARTPIAACRALVRCATCGRRGTACTCPRRVRSAVGSPSRGRPGRRPGPRWRLTEANGGAAVALTSGVSPEATAPRDAWSPRLVLGGSRRPLGRARPPGRDSGRGDDA